MPYPTNNAALDVNNDLNDAYIQRIIEDMDVDGLPAEAASGTLTNQAQWDLLEATAQRIYVELVARPGTNIDEQWDLAKSSWNMASQWLLWRNHIRSQISASS